MENGFIKYIVIIVVILAIVFLSQKMMLPGNVKSFISAGQSQAGKYVSDGYNWAKNAVLSTINGEVQKGGEAINNEINQQKENVSQSVGEKLKNYFTGIENSIIHPGTPQNCPAASGPSSGQ